VDNFFIRRFLKSSFKLGIKEGIPDLIAPPPVYALTGEVFIGGGYGGGTWGGPPSGGK